ncbi:hypothetical protein OKW45_001950 [Paraburkholderia sp. WSM4175]|uniref:hypothetical protein n=1 Tax=Paraburkholderia sp. WSM4175 TaxID=2991072 RepID=UPI003D2118E3
MASAGTLIFELAANVSRLRTDMQRAQAEMKKSLESIARTSAVTAAKMGLDFATSFARSFASAIATGNEQTVAMARLAERFGTTTEAISTLDYVARQSNISTDALAGSMRNLAKTMIDAQNPASTQAAALRAIGLSVDELRAKDPAQAMADIADAMSGFADGADKVAVARAIFGKTGDELIPMLNQGGEAFRSMEERAKALGIAVSDDAARAAIEFDAKLTDLKVIVDGLKRSLAAELNPTISAFADWAINAAQEGGALQTVLQGIAYAANVAAKAFVGFTGLAVGASNTWNNFKDTLSKVGKSKEEMAVIDARMAARAEDTRRAMDQAADAQTKIQKAYEEGTRGLQQHGTTTAATTKKTLDFKAAQDKAAKSTKTAKAAVDEYAKAMQSLQEELRRVQAAGDSTLLLLSDPKFLQFSTQQQQALLAVREQIDALTRAQQAESEEHERAKRAWADLQSMIDSNAQQVDGWVQTQLDAIDPTREFHRELDLLNAAFDEGAIVGDEYHAILGNIIARFDESVNRLDPLKQQTEDLTRAIEQFGRNSADMFVDWISGADNSSKSFGEMTASILRDMAKMLMYKQVMEPLFDWFGKLSGGGSSGGLFGLIGGLFGRSAAAEPLPYAGQRMAGGPVLPGHLYRVNESPFAREFFSPGVPGRVDSIRNDNGVNVSITVNAQTGATEVQGATADAIELGKRMATVARQVIADERRAGGLLAAS